LNLDQSIYLLDILGTLAFAISGALSGRDKSYDLFGIFVVASLTALGGGTVRDLLLGISPVSWMMHTEYLLVVVFGVFVSILFRKYIGHLRKTLHLFDAIGIGVFTIIGIEKALEVGVSPFIAVLMGTMTAVFGGLMRDIFNNEIPLILRKEIYATACLFGGMLFFFFTYIGMMQIWIELSTIILIILIRLLSVYFRLSLPVIRN
jgi:uncharacterized membrane protein YeiH